MTTYDNDIKNLKMSIYLAILKQKEGITILEYFKVLTSKNGIFSHLKKFLSSDLSNPLNKHLHNIRKENPEYLVDLFIPQTNIPFDFMITDLIRYDPTSLIIIKKEGEPIDMLSSFISNGNLNCTIELSKFGRENFNKFII